MSFTSMRAWIRRQHWGWQIPLFAGYALLWCAWHAFTICYHFIAVVLESIFSRRPAIRVRRRRIATNLKMASGVVVAAFVVLVALLVPHLLGQLVFTIIMLYALYKGGRMALLGRW